MHLADRGRRERLGAKARKTASGAPPSSRWTISSDLGVGEGRHLVEQLEQLVAVGGREEVEAQGQHLAELDPGPPQLLQRGAHPHRPAASRRRKGRAGRTKAGVRTTSTRQARRRRLTGASERGPPGRRGGLRRPAPVRPSGGIRRAGRRACAGPPSTATPTPPSENDLDAGLPDGGQQGPPEGAVGERPARRPSCPPAPPRGARGPARLRTRSGRLAAPSPRSRGAD